MEKRNLRVVKWLGTVPAGGVCTQCSTNFTVSLDLLKSTSASQESLRKQFAEHTCKQLNSRQDTLRVVRESTENK